MRKVLILANDTTYAYNLRNEIIESLVSNGYEVVVASQPLLLQEELKRLGARLIDIETNRHGTNPFSDIGLMKKYLRVIKAENPDVVLTYNIKPNVYGGMACRKTKKPYIPNITGLGTAVENPGFMQTLSTRLYKCGIARAACVMFQNEDNRQFFVDRKLLPRKADTRVLPGSGVSLKIHKPMDYPIDEKTVHFLFIARVMQEKGIDYYLSAAKRIYEKHKNVMFHTMMKVS